MVPNYLAARPNCLTTSSFYVVCCRNECEELMGKIEETVENEMATADQILSLVSTMSTDTVDWSLVEAPRFLSNTLKERLWGIAAANNGSVPLHGRLFAQWMHHAFPRECPYPHQASSASPQSADEWLEATGHTEATLSAEELHAHVQSKHEAELPVGAEARKQHHFEENELPWDHTEELLTSAKTVTEALTGKASTPAEAQSTLRTVVG